jgi:hypothetical protein
MHLRHIVTAAASSGLALAFLTGCGGGTDTETDTVVDKSVTIDGTLSGDETVEMGDIDTSKE